jgi:cytochrome c553
MRRLASLLLLSASITGAGITYASEGQLKLASDADATLVMARCAVCHSVDYIQMNAPFMKRATWEAEVKKMIKAYGAPVADDEANRIVDYLTRHYGVE